MATDGGGSDGDKDDNGNNDADDNDNDNDDEDDDEMGAWEEAAMADTEGGGSGGTAARVAFGSEKGAEVAFSRTRKKSNGWRM